MHDVRSGFSERGICARARASAAIPVLDDAMHGESIPRFLDLRPGTFRRQHRHDRASVDQGVCQACHEVGATVPVGRVG